MIGGTSMVGRRGSRLMRPPCAATYSPTVRTPRGHSPLTRHCSTARVVSTSTMARCDWPPTLTPNEVAKTWSE